MGVYWLAVCTSRGEVVDAETLGTGNKWGEIRGELGAALVVLLATRWQGESVEVVSDGGGHDGSLHERALDFVESGGWRRLTRADIPDDPWGPQTFDRSPESESSYLCDRCARLGCGAACLRGCTR